MAAAAHLSTLPAAPRVDLDERIRENRFATLPEPVRLDQVTELVDLVPPADFEPLDRQAQWLLLYGIGAL